MKHGPGTTPSVQSTRSTPPPEDTENSVIDWFRAASPYIKAHRGKTLVLALPGNWLRNELLPTLTHDLTLLSHLGLRLVVCFGLRAQVDEELARDSVPSAIIAGRRVTDDNALSAIIEATGVTRNTLESRLTMGLPNTPMSGARLTVSSGNYVTAQPFGVHNGVDFQHTGAVREVHAKPIKALLDAGHLVLLPPLGYSVTGEVFNITVNDMATAVATTLEADKLVFLVNELPLNEQGQVLRQASARKLESRYASVGASGLGVSGTAGSESSGQGEAADAEALNELDSIIEKAITACRHGVERVHLLQSSNRDALLSELYTRDGSGTMITAARWEHIRQAGIADVGGIIKLIEPLQANGTLVSRSREQLELDIENFVVSERDGAVVACAALYPDQPSSSVEIACIATHPHYRGEGRAAELLSHLEAAAKDRGFTFARVLSTRTGHWFLEKGYVAKAPEDLPASRLTSYSQQRNSKIYVKRLA